MKSSTTQWTRRRVLKGGGGRKRHRGRLPILDCLLNTNGTAFAASGCSASRRALGVGSGAWDSVRGTGRPRMPAPTMIFPCSFNPEALQKKLNLFSGSEVFLDGQANQTHFSGVQGFMTGKVTGAGDYFSSIDSRIADVIGNGTRFRSIEVACDGDPKASWTARESGKQPAEVSPLRSTTRSLALSSRTPTPQISSRTRISSCERACSQGSRKSGRSSSSASERPTVRSSMPTTLHVRALEQRLALQLQKPEPLPSCTKPDAPQEEKAMPFRSPPMRWSVTTSLQPS